MITEKGTVKTTTAITESVYDELNKPTKNLGIVCTVFGSIFLFIAVVCFFYALVYGLAVSGLGILIFLGCVLLLPGIYFLMLCKNFKASARRFRKADEVEFFSDYVIVREYTDGEHTATNKVYYKWLVKIKDSTRYLFLYTTKTAAVPIEKASLSSNELNTVNRLLGRPSFCGASTSYYQQYGGYSNGYNNGWGNSFAGDGGFKGPFNGTNNGGYNNGTHGGNAGNAQGAPSDPFKEFPSNGDNNGSDGKTLSDD